jgi:hypothetical protein
MDREIVGQVVQRDGIVRSIAKNGSKLCGRAFVVAGLFGCGAELQSRHRKARFG